MLSSDLATRSYILFIYLTLINKSVWLQVGDVSGGCDTVVIVIPKAHARTCGLTNRRGLRGTTGQNVATECLGNVDG